jgi:hypothetical protein
MERKTSVKRLLRAVVLAAVVTMSCADAFAADHGRSNDRSRDNGWNRDSGRSRHQEVVVVGRERYNYHDGRFYRPGFFGFEFVLSTPPFGAVVMSLPIGHRAVIIGGAQYYNYDNIYYSPSLRGILLFRLR